MDLSDFLDNLEKAVTVLAILMGAVLAYINFIKGRIYNIRLVPTVSGHLCSDGRTPYLIVKLDVKNAGVGRAEIRQEGSGLRISACNLDPSVSVPGEPEWQHLGTYPVFTGQEGLESGESLQEEKVIEIPRNDFDAFLLELRLVSKRVEIETNAVVSNPVATQARN